jgi:hypothetical protein
VSAFLEVRPTDVPALEGPFDVAIVTQRVTPEGRVVMGGYDPVSEFVRCVEK